MSSETCDLSQVHVLMKMKNRCSQQRHGFNRGYHKALQYAARLVKVALALSEHRERKLVCFNLIG